MKKIIFLNVFLCFAYGFSSYSQVGIGNASPQAALDITSTTDGLLIPRVALTATNVSAPIVTITDSEMVYNTATAGTSPNNVIPGYYYWNASSLKWISLSAVGGTDWLLGGNSGTTAGPNFLGTSDNVDLILKRNNIQSGRLGLTNTSFGLSALNSDTGGLNNVAIGTEALSSSVTSQNNNALGYQSLKANTGNNNNAFGYQALLSNTSGTPNNAFGNQALKLNTTGNNNCAFGDQALMNNVIGSDNTAIGNQVLSNNTGSSNTAIGSGSMVANTTGYYNTAAGYQSLGVNTFGAQNTAIGYYSLQKNTTGNGNTAIGAFSSVNNTTGSGNTIVGNFAFLGVTGSYNTAIGTYAATNGPNYSYSTAIGYSSAYTADHMVRIGDPTTTSIGGQVGWTTVSDKRFKKDIQTNVPGLNFIKKLRPVTYHLDQNAIATFLKTPANLRNKEGEKVKQGMLQTGFIAQEVEQAAKDANYTFSGVDTPKNENDYYGLRYEEFVVPLVKAIQEQQDIIDADNKLISTLKANQKALEQRLIVIEAKLGK